VALVLLAWLAVTVPTSGQGTDARLPALTDVIRGAAPAVVTLMLPSGAIGSGFGVAANGAVVILTARHLVARTPLTVRLRDGSTWPATIVGQLPQADLAALRIDARAPLATLPVGDSRRLQVGEWVVAIGNPFGLGLTASAGIVGATGRSLGPSTGELIQTDAAINPGNSGGPLINLRGEAVAVATAAVTVGQGLGFAVPIHLADVLHAPR
jgi:serine protease Do